jgi:hypothetical protein
MGVILGKPMVAEAMGFIGLAYQGKDTLLDGIRACVTQRMGLILIKPIAEGFTMPASAWNPLLWTT